VPGRTPAAPATAAAGGASDCGNHSNSDSGRSSSSKSSGSLSGRGQPLSDGGTPPPVDGYEGVVRDLEDKLRERDMEDKLRERDLELLQLRDNLDDNEAAICQVRQPYLLLHLLILPDPSPLTSGP